MYNQTQCTQVFIQQGEGGISSLAWVPSPRFQTKLISTCNNISAKSLPWPQNQSQSIWILKISWWEHPQTPQEQCVSHDRLFPLPKKIPDETLVVYMIAYMYTVVNTYMYLLSMAIWLNAGVVPGFPSIPTAHCMKRKHVNVCALYCIVHFH